MSHTLCHCVFIDKAFRYIAQYFLDWDAGLLGIKSFLEHNLAESLMARIRVLAWTAIYANWKDRNTARASPDARLTDDYFFRLWGNALTPFISSNSYTILLSDSASKIVASFAA